MRPLYRAGQRDTCTVRSQPVIVMYLVKVFAILTAFREFASVVRYIKLYAKKKIPLIFPNILVSEKMRSNQYLYVT